MVVDAQGAVVDAEKEFGSNVIIIKDENHEHIALMIGIDSDPDETTVKELKKQGYDIVFLDLSWGKGGITYNEMEHVLREDTTKKDWIYHNLIEDCKKRLQEISEPIDGSGGGIAHLYYACPLTSESVQDVDCWYCKYRLGKNQFEGLCFAKAGVQNYQDLLEIEHVEKEENKIVSIVYNKNGEKLVKHFEKNVKLPGDSLIELWHKKRGTKLIAHNIYNDWYVLLEKDPTESISKSGEVYGRLSRNLGDLIYAPVRPIFNYDCKYWVENN